MARLATLILLCGLVAGTYAVGLQAIGAKGTFMCGNKPEVGTRVALWDEDDGPDPDDKLAEAYTDSQGHFEVKGSTHELTNIDGRLKVYTDCNDGLPGKRKIKWIIPDKYITHGVTTPKELYNLGTVNLEAKFPGEERNLLD